MTTENASESVHTDDRGLPIQGDVNPPLRDIEKLFDQLPRKGTPRSVDLADWDQPFAHLQGMAVYRRRWVILTHSGTIGWGYFIVHDLQVGRTETYNIENPEGYLHPGGMQIVGDYLVVGIEPSSSDDHASLIYFYDISDIAETGPRKIAHPTIKQSGPGGKGAACVAMARLRDRYVLAVYGSSPDGKIYFYLSNDKRLGEPGLEFDPTPRASFRASIPGEGSFGYDNMSLATDIDHNLYLIGLRGDGSVPVKDYGDLWWLDLESTPPSRRLANSIHFTTTENTGLIGDHFRYGAGATAINESTLQIYCSPRNTRSPSIQAVFNLFGNGGNW